MGPGNDLYGAFKCQFACNGAEPDCVSYFGKYGECSRTKLFLRGYYRPDLTLVNSGNRTGLPELRVLSVQRAVSVLRCTRPRVYNSDREAGWTLRCSCPMTPVFLPGATTNSVTRRPAVCNDPRNAACGYVYRRYAGGRPVPWVIK